MINLRISITSLITIVILLVTSSVIAGGVYQKPHDFIDEVFAKQPPKAKVLWITKKLRAQLESILDHSWQGGLRVRYWQKGQRSAWILNEIGKEQPITIGVVINQQKIEQVKVLIFRESRGWEIRHPFFTDQFHHLALQPTLVLDKSIDGISGATLSVRAVTKMVRIALFLEQSLHEKK